MDPHFSSFHKCDKWSFYFSFLQIRGNKRVYILILYISYENEYRVYWPKQWNKMGRERERDGFIFKKWFIKKMLYLYCHALMVIQKLCKLISIIVALILRYLIALHLLWRSRFKKTGQSRHIKIWRLHKISTPLLSIGAF